METLKLFFYEIFKFFFKYISLVLLFIIKLFVYVGNIFFYFFKLTFRIIFFFFLILYDIFIKFFFKKILYTVSYLSFYLYNYGIIRIKSLKMIILKINHFPDYYSSVYRKYRVFFTGNWLLLAFTSDILLLFKKIISILKNFFILFLKYFFFRIKHSFVFILNYILKLIAYLIIFFRKLLNEIHLVYLEINSILLKFKFYFLYRLKKYPYLYNIFYSLRLGYIFFIIYIYLALVYPSLNFFLEIFNNYQWESLSQNLSWYGPMINLGGEGNSWYFSLHDSGDFFLVRIFLSLVFFLVFIPHVRTLWYKELQWDSSIVESEFDKDETEEEEDDLDEADIESEDPDQAGDFLDDYYDDLREKSYILVRSQGFSYANGNFIKNESGWGFFISSWIFIFYYAIKMFFWPYGNLRIPFIPYTDISTHPIIDEIYPMPQFSNFLLENLNIYSKWLPANSISNSSRWVYENYSNRTGFFSHREISPFGLKYVRPANNVWPNYDYLTNMNSHKNEFSVRIFNKYSVNSEGSRGPFEAKPHFLGSVNYIKLLNHDASTDLKNPSLYEQRSNAYSAIDSFKEIYGSYPLVNKNLNFYLRSIYSSKNYLNSFFNSYTTLQYWNNKDFNYGSGITFNTGLNYMNNNPLSLNSDTNFMSYNSIGGYAHPNFGLDRIWLNLVEKRDMNLNLPMTYDLASNAKARAGSFHRFPINSVAFSEKQIEEASGSTFLFGLHRMYFPQSYDYGLRSEYLDLYKLPLWQFQNSKLLYDGKILNNFLETLSFFQKNYYNSFSRKVFLKYWFEQQEGKFPGMKLYLLANKDRSNNYYNIADYYNSFNDEYSMDYVHENDQELIMADKLDSHWFLANNFLYDRFSFFDVEGWYHYAGPMVWHEHFFSWGWYKYPYPRYLRPYTNDLISMEKEVLPEDSYGVRRFFEEETSNRMQKNYSYMKYYNKADLRLEGKSIAEHMAQPGRYLDMMFGRENKFQESSRFFSLSDTIYDFSFFQEYIESFSSINDRLDNNIKSEYFLGNDSFLNYYNPSKFFSGKYFPNNGRALITEEVEDPDFSLIGWVSGMRSLPMPYYGELQLKLLGIEDLSEKTLNYFENYIDKDLTYLKFLFLNSKDSLENTLDSFFNSPLFKLWYKDWNFCHMMDVSSEILDEEDAALENAALPYQLYIKDNLYIYKKEYIVDFKALTLSQLSLDNTFIFKLGNFLSYYVIENFYWFLTMADRVWDASHATFYFKKSVFYSLQDKFLLTFFYSFANFEKKDSFYFLYDDLKYGFSGIYVNHNILEEPLDLYAFGTKQIDEYTLTLNSLKALPVESNKILLNYFFSNRNGNFVNLFETLGLVNFWDRSFSCPLHVYLNYDIFSIFQSLKVKSFFYDESIPFTLSDSLFYSIDLKDSLAIEVMERDLSAEHIFDPAVDIDWDLSLKKNMIFQGIIYNDFWYGDYISWYLNTYDLSYMRLPKMLKFYDLTYFYKIQ